MDAEKAHFLRNGLVPLLQKISTDTKPAWGKLTLQQMVEHFAGSIRVASGKTAHIEVITAPEHFQKARDFMLSEKPFRENTVNPLMPETPAPARNATYAAAVKELEEELHFFFHVFEKNNLAGTRNPFFGDLNFAQNIHLLHKHALHHLRQFGATVQ